MKTYNKGEIHIMSNDFNAQKSEKNPDYSRLDSLTSECLKSGLTIIASRPANGKTSLALTILYNMAVKYGKPVAFFSLAQPSSLVLDRLLAVGTEIELDKIRNCTLPYEEQALCGLENEKLKTAPIFIDDTPGLSVKELSEKIRSIVREYGTKVVIIDYLQLMTMGDMKYLSRQTEMESIMHTLKVLAAELSICMIVLYLLNKWPDNPVDPIKWAPQLSELIETGINEQYADMIIFIYRPKLYGSPGNNSDRDTRETTEITIDKNSHGLIGSLQLHFITKMGKFCD